MKLAAQMAAIAENARAAEPALRSAPDAVRSEAIRAAARALRAQRETILDGNRADLASASGFEDRLRLDEARIAGIAASLDAVASLPDPVGAVLARWTRPNGLDMARVRTPIGVIGMIYESRPNVTAEAAAICLRSANVLILRSGSQGLNSALAIHQAIETGIVEAGLPAGCVQIAPTADRDAVGTMLEGLNGAIDLIIPRGGKTLVERVSREARVPTLGHLEGLCHTYVHASADPAMAVAIVSDAKMRRPTICGATETLLVDHTIAPQVLPRLAAAIPDCELRGDAVACTMLPMRLADDSDWATEYLAPILAVRVVKGLDEAIAHIERYGTGHTDAIVAEDAAAAEAFVDRIDSSIVLWNASTQFADGGEFGFGAEIGIATGRLHARGPVGPEQLTTFKYIVRGNGQVRG